jgi:hypothetical protein
MEGQHHRVEDCTERLATALARWEAEARSAVTEEVAATFQELADVLFLHLGEEEQHILPLAARHVTQQEWDELGEHGMQTMPKAELPFLFGALIEDATPEERKEMYAHVPLPVRLLLKTVFAGQYRPAAVAVTRRGGPGPRRSGRVPAPAAPTSRGRRRGARCRAGPPHQ